MNDLQNLPQNVATCPKMSQLAPLAPEREGNTKPRVNRSRAWCFTFHNYTKDNLTQLPRTFEENNLDYLFSEEQGKEGKTPHLQGYLRSKNTIRFETLKRLFPTFHLEPAKGNLSHQFKYIEKEGGNLYTNIKKPYTETPEKPINELRPWQQHIIDLLALPPNKRTIYWVFNESGNVGKSSLCYKLFVEGKISWIRTANTNDVKHLLSEHKNSRDIIFDMPRNSHPNWTLLEELKDGILYSGKYEGAIKLITTPHIFVMSNNKPPKGVYSDDRIKLITVNSDLTFNT